ncbi:hypothetical protein BWQ96_07394 [Gracilariopsis chorda]|uniref:Uncharacterized protein n=1 Tax=Gracilariopsis chorda TaxID=448386 RepID=A0A2V3ILC7_9FLOR|nr:hypothetical protein BWQ96_07391 [Gracilariopsis chorda]PXF42886.1 hypothetical protein BWQ96_07394 [Gracilariopsis chorda]|eukprot:PXF42883.1 hypothetical protein BWQ96_07391 [Gracilariopsis chorda]
MPYQYSYYSRCGAFNKSPTLTDEQEYAQTTCSQLDKKSMLRRFKSFSK